MLRRSRLTGKATLFEVKPLAIAELVGEICEAAAAAEEQPKLRKVVEFHILASIIDMRASFFKHSQQK